MIKRNNVRLTLLLLLGLSVTGLSQKVTPSRDEIIKLTSQWKGERSADGRPRVSDELLARLRNISMEEAWGVLRNKGYHNQYEGNWVIIHPDSSMSGRVVTAQYMPMRPDFHDMIKETGKEEGRGQAGFTNSWPIEVLKEGDVYVADGYGKIIDGTLIGDNLGNSIYARSKRGVVFYGGVRDVAGLTRIQGFNAWHKGEDPSFIKDMMLAGINTPIRIGRATVLPGDAILAKKGGVVFIPAHLLAEVVITSEITALRDEFGIQRLKEGKYLPGDIDSQWSEAIRKDFLNWVNNYPGKLPMSKKELDDYLKERNY
ncbi:MAG: dimethylmenaquinone methyltransferase [Cytophagaceae bacterium SCN 52-12]|nr:MAG: dimethylmenaquinone methyltransferase [Cytophagaceae bacterium SCN 52-12]